MNPKSTSPYGFFGFPSKSDHNSLFLYKEFYSSGSYQIPTQHTFITIMLVAAGSGGGSGACKASGVISSGGSGGAPGSIIIKTFFIKDLIKYGNILEIEIGSGGMGGAAVNTPDADGNDGGQGGASRIKFSGSPVYFMNARGFPAGTLSRGKGGFSGSYSLTTADNKIYSGIYNGKSYNAWRDRMETWLSNLGSSAYSVNHNVRPGSGFGGAGKNASDNYFSGLMNMTNNGLGTPISTGSWRYTHWGFSGVSNPGQEVSFLVQNLPRRMLFLPNWFHYGFSAPASSTVAGTGSSGNLGSGGGGGGGTINGGTSGAGGNGGNGYCLIVSRG